MLLLEVHIIVGLKDSTPDSKSRIAEIGWQGINHIEKARNYYKAINEMFSDFQLKDKIGDDKVLNFHLYELENTGHDSSSGAKKAIEILLNK